jgi:hypothetical protein
MVQTRPHVSNGFPAGPPGTMDGKLLMAVHDESYFVQMGIDVVRDLAEVAPFLAEFWRFMSRFQ